MYVPQVRPQHWHDVRGSSSGRGVLHQRKFQDIHRRLRFGSFLSQIADGIIASWWICLSWVSVLIIAVNEVELHHVKKCHSGHLIAGEQMVGQRKSCTAIALSGGKSSVLCQTKYLCFNSIGTLWYNGVWMDCQKYQNSLKRRLSVKPPDVSTKVASLMKLRQKYLEIFTLTGLYLFVPGLRW